MSFSGLQKTKGGVLSRENLQLLSLSLSHRVGQRPRRAVDRLEQVPAHQVRVVDRIVLGRVVDVGDLADVEAGAVPLGGSGRRSRSGSLGRRRSRRRRRCLTGLALAARLPHGGGLLLRVQRLGQLPPPVVKKQKPLPAAGLRVGGHPLPRGLRQSAVGLFALPLALALALLLTLSRGGRRGWSPRRCRARRR